MTNDTPSPGSNSKWLVVLDFDRTLFDTAQFYQDFLETIASNWGAELETTLRDVESTGSHLDPFGYLETHHNLEYSTVARAFHAFMDAKYPAGHSYLFEGAAELVQYLRTRPHTTVMIITTGTDQSQRFKLSLSPELAHLKYEIISENKGAVLESQFERAGGITYKDRRYNRFVLVDDKDSVLKHITPHEHRLLVHIIRDDAKFRTRTGRADVQEVTSLKEIISILSVA